MKLPFCPYKNLKITNLEKRKKKAFFCSDQYAQYQPKCLKSAVFKPVQNVNILVLVHVLVRYIPTNIYIYIFVRASGIPTPLGLEPQPNNTVTKPRPHTTLKPIWTNDLHQFTPSPLASWFIPINCSPRSEVIARSYSFSVARQHLGNIDAEHICRSGKQFQGHSYRTPLSIHLAIIILDLLPTNPKGVIMILPLI